MAGCRADHQQPRAQREAGPGGPIYHVARREPRGSLPCARQSQLPAPVSRGSQARTRRQSLPPAGARLAPTQLPEEA
jgi:hypothetical protein